VIADNALVIPPVVSGLVQACGVMEADGLCLPQSLTWRGQRAMMTAPALPDGPVKHLAGTHLYGGQLWMHFGHFLCESLSRLWALDAGGPVTADRPLSLVFIPKRPDSGAAIKAFQTQFMALLGIELPITVLTSPTQVERLIVPGQGFGLGAIAAGTPEFRAFTRRRMAQDVVARGGPSLYISRSALGGLEGGIALEEALEANLAAAGYEIFHPQQHSLEEQVARYRAASRIVGLDGSAFHMFGFVGRPDQRTAVILRRNSSVYQGLERQITAFTGTPPQIIRAVVADWLPEGKKRAGRYSFGQLDFEAVGAALREGGFIAPDADWRVPKWRELKQALGVIEKDKGFALARKTRPERQKRQAGKGRTSANDMAPAAEDATDRAADKAPAA